MKLSLSRCCSAWFLALFLWSHTGQAGNRLDGRYWTSIRPERLITPCEPFAADYVTPPRILFFVSGKVGGREVAELHQRLKMEFEAMVYVGEGGVNQLGTNDMYISPIEGTRPDEQIGKLNRLLEKEKWDVFVFGHMTSFGALPARAQHTLLEQVAQGAGLVIFQPMHNFERRGYPEAIAKGEPAEQGESILPGVPVSLLPPLAAASANPKTAMARRWDFGKGRVVWMTTRGEGDGNQNIGIHSLTPFMPYRPEEEVRYSEYLSAAAKAILAAQPSKTPRVRPAPENARVVPVAAPGEKARVSAGLFLLPEPVTVKAVVRDLTGWRMALPDVSLAKGDAVPLEFDLPPLAAGDHLLNYRLVSSAGTEYWGTLGIQVAAGRGAIATLGVPEGVPPLQRVENGFVLPVTLSGENLENLVLGFEGGDREGRTIFQGSFPVKETSLEIRADLKLASSIPHLLRVELRDGSQVISRGITEFFVRQPMPEFVNLIWGGAYPSVLGLPRMAQLRKAGFNTFMMAGKDHIALQVARGNAHNMDMNFRVLLNPLGPKDQPDDTLANPVYLQKLLEQPNSAPAKSAGPYREYINIYNLGDENGFNYSRPQVPPSELAGFRAMVQAMYAGNLELLNKEWGTKLQSFEEIEVPNMDVALPLEEIPRKLAWMRYIETTYADIHHKVAEIIRKNDPDPSKFIGAEGSKMGNPEQTLPGLTMWGPYPSRLYNAFMRSFGSRDLLRGNWWGAYLRERPSGGQPLWEQVLGGSVNASFYFMDLAGEGMLGTEFGFAEYFEKDQWPVMLEINAGLGPLLGSLPPRLSGVGLLYSHASEQAQSVEIRFGSQGSTRNGLLAWTDEAGLSSMFYSEKQISEGKLEKDGVRILFLPQSYCLDDGTAGLLKKWVEAGGTLVADLHPGMRNGRGAARASGLLDELFGVVLAPAGNPVIKNVGWDLGEGQRLELEGMILDGGVEAKGAEPIVKLEGGGELLFTRTLGKGKTLLLNFSLGKALANQGADPALNRFMRTLMESAGVAVDLQIPKGYMVVRFQNEGMELLSNRILPGAEETGVIRIPQKRHIYDVRLGKYLGEGVEIQPSAGTGRNSLYALTEQPVSPFKLEARGKIARGAVVPLEVIPAGTSGPRRLYRLDFQQADGTAEPTLRRFQWGASNVSFALPLAWNLAAGTHRVQVTDVTTGQSASLEIPISKE